jgi:hypothetical protein
VDDVRLPDLETIRRYSIAVRSEHAPVEEVIEALEEDLRAIQRLYRGRSGAKRQTAPAPAKRGAAAPAPAKTPARPAQTRSAPARKPAAAAKTAAKTARRSAGWADSSVGGARTKTARSTRRR